LPRKDWLKWAEFATCNHYKWLNRFGKIYGRNSKTPRDRWLDKWEEQAILDFHDKGTEMYPASFACD
jgi:putative transposase